MKEVILKCQSFLISKNIHYGKVLHTSLIVLSMILLQNLDKLYALIGIMRYLKALAVLHITIIALTNVSVQYPITIFGFHSTWGVFSYPLIFIITDLTVRLLGATTARRTVIVAMLPGLFISYVLANWFSNAHAIIAWNPFAFRVAFASFSAYLSGQLMDIFVFQHFRQNRQWWVAPSASSFVGNIVDTFWFFFAAFYHSTNPFFAQHWVEIAFVDLGFKLFISFLSFIPIYGLILRLFQRATLQY